MNNLTKTILYVVLVAAAIFFGAKFYSNYKQTKARGETELTSTDATTAREAAVAPKVDASTNQSTNAADTNAVADTNQANATTNAQVVTTNAADTNAAAVSNATAQVTNETTPAAASVNTAQAPPAKRGGTGSMMAYMGAFLATVIVLGLMLARDVSGMIGQGAIDFLFNDDLKGVYDPEYEEALNAVHKGQYLPAIQMLREFLEKNPHAQYAALEIAEIYEKRLNNQLAAALEYEEVLKKKLQPERWGWAAIHLCNLYSKMGQTDKTLALLKRIVDEYGQTAAANKARKRLAMYESGGDMASLAVDSPDFVQPDAEAAETSEAPKPIKVKVVKPVEAVKEPEPASPNLPPGFRPKK